MHFNNDTDLYRTIAVSYTHLDVYKRQDIRRRLIKIRSINLRQIRHIFIGMRERKW